MPLAPRLPRLLRFPGGPAGPAAAWMLATGLSLSLWPVLPGWAALLLCGAGAALLLGCVQLEPRCRFGRGSSARVRPALVAVAALLLALGSSQWRIADRLQDALDPALEGRDLLLTGTIASLPSRSPSGLRFEFRVDAAEDRGEALRVGAGGAGSVPRSVSMAWFTGFHEDAVLSPAQLSLQAGQRWRFAVRLRQVHGARNPHGFDLERHLFAQGLRAAGVVRSATGPLPGRATAGGTIARARQAVRDAVFEQTGHSRAGGVLAALVVGDQTAIARSDWDLFRDTGVAHLMAISGLHVTMFAWAAGLGVAVLWRRLPGLLHRVPAPLASRVGGLAAATAYAVFAGWGVPAQRTVLMLAVVTFLSLRGRLWPWPSVLLLAGAAVSLFDPWALLDVGFWLSFAAVGLLMACGPALEAPDWTAALQGAQPAPAGGPGALRRALGRCGPVLRDAVRTQWIASVGLAPLTLVLFHQVSLVGFLANLAAVPWVTLVVTPLAMLGVLLPPAWTAGAWAVDAMGWALSAMATWPAAVWRAAASPWPVQAAALLGGVLAVMPLPGAVRVLALPLMLPLVWPAVPVPPHGRFELVALDVGQGTSVLVRTRSRLLVYDAGPQSGRDSNAGERILVPLLQARGERRVDQLLLSHRDLDHVGGAASLMRSLPVGELRSSLEPGHALLDLAGELGVARAPCEAGQSWHWDGVRFELLHPGPGEIERPFGGVGAGARANDRSCVLKVTAAGFDGDLSAWPERNGPPQVLLTGDVEALAEAQLVSSAGDALRSAIVFAPHHGSRTSSTPPFVDAVAARWVLVQAAYRSRFGHPAPAVVARWERQGGEVVQTPVCGAWTWRPGAAGPVCERARTHRHWQHPQGRDGPGPGLGPPPG